MSGEPAERIEELENRVNALEATVSGLTEELVDRTERVRALEAETGVVPGATSQRIITAGEGDGSGATDGGTASTGAAEAASAGGETGGEATDSEQAVDGETGEPEMIVPEPEDGRADGPSTQTAGSSDDTPITEGERATSDEGQSSGDTAEPTDDQARAGDAADADDGTESGDGAAESGDDIIVA